MLLLNKLLKLDLLMQQLDCFFLCREDYTRKEIYQLWKRSGLTICQVGYDLCKSYERAREYCYGVRMERKLRIEIAHYFKKKINEKKKY
jgi:hypothetical protein